MAGHLGQFEYCVMPFGLKNAPAVFQRFISRILCDCDPLLVSVYLDDINIHTNKTIEHHVAVVKQVLQILLENDLYLRPDKCTFAQKVVTFIGREISKDGISPIKEKIQVFKFWKLPKTVTDLRSFLGTANYYRQFIKCFADIAGPLYRFIGVDKKKKSRLSEWTKRGHNCF